MNVLFIGNSFTFYNDLPGIFRNMASAAGYDVFTDSIAYGGYYLRQFTDTESGSEVYGKLNSNRWDYVIIQEQSRNPLSDREDFYTNARILIEHIREIGAIPVLYQTWAYKNGSEKLEKTGLSYDEMYAGLKDAYEELGNETNTEVVPVGTAFYQCAAEYPDIDIYDKKDNYHPSAEGSYLASCVFFYKLLGGKKRISFTAGLDKKTAYTLQRIAKHTVLPKRRLTNIFYHLIVLVFTAVFVFSAYKIADYYIQANKSAAGFSKLYNIVQSVDMPSITPNDKYGTLKQQNPDFIGWITIQDTNINYPVMQTNDRPDFYLRRDFDGNYSYYGTPYAEENCVVGVSDNVIIYAHNMRNGTMFSALENYSSEDFYNSHRYIEFDTLEDFGTYEIIAVFKIAADTDTFYYYEFTDAESESEYDSFVSECKSRSLYDTGVSAVYGDKLITLSTCEYSNTNGRLVIVAKKI